MTDARSRLSSLAGIAARFGLKALESQVKACESLLSAGAAINAAVLGKFKAGKSSFLNSLAGTGVLPAGALPVTAVVTELFWSPEETASVRVVGGETLPISLEQVPDYVSEELNPKNARGAAAVSLGLPALADYKGVRFVDTPGLDSALRHNTETSLDWLPNAGLAIVAVSSDAPLSEQDLALISRTRRHSPSITVLLTKADRLEPAELDRVLGFVRGRLRERFGADFGVYPYSVKDGFGAMRAEFRDKVLLPFAGGLASEKARILEHKLGSLERQCRDYLLAARAAAAKSAGERRALGELVAAQKSRLGVLSDDFKTLLSRNSGRCRAELEKLFLTRARGLEKELEERVRRELSARPMSLLAMTRAYAAALEDFFPATTAELFLAEKDRLNALARELSASFTGLAGDFSAGISAEAEKVLGARLPRPAVEPRRLSLPAPDVRVGQAFDSHLELLWFLVPARLLRKRLLDHFAGLLPFEVEKNLTRLAMGLAGRINTESEAVMKEALAGAAEVQSTIERLLLAAPDSLGAIESALAGLGAGSSGEEEYGT